MRNLILSVCLSLVSFSAMASCQELAARIDAKLQAKGVKSYTLSIVPVAKPGAAVPTAAASAPAATATAAASAPAATTAAAATTPQGKVVGICDGGTKQILYTRH